jgi:hypothetical protein
MFRYILPTSKLDIIEGFHTNFLHHSEFLYENSVTYSPLISIYLKKMALGKAYYIAAAFNQNIVNKSKIIERLGGVFHLDGDKMQLNDFVIVSYNDNSESKPLSISTTFKYTGHNSDEISQYYLSQFFNAASRIDNIEPNFIGLISDIINEEFLSESKNQISSIDVTEQRQSRIALPLASNDKYVS